MDFGLLQCVSKGSFLVKKETYIYINVYIINIYIYIYISLWWVMLIIREITCVGEAGGQGKVSEPSNFIINLNLL